MKTPDGGEGPPPLVYNPPMVGEFQLIEWIRSRRAPRGGIVVDIGDDLAALRWDGADLLLVGVDQVLDGVHFDSAVHLPEAIGAKVMNRNLSDCAAMACLPAAAVVTVALPRTAGLDYAKALDAGLRKAGDAFDCPIIGGDTASWDGKLLLTVTILGRSAGVAPIPRGGAKAGDGIFVTGALGGSLLGRHMTFRPRVLEARAMAAIAPISAMIDLSDGLSRDVGHIADQSGVAALIEADAVPIHADARESERRDGQSPLHHALHDGEDHELLFTAPATFAAALAPWAQPIGRIEAGSGVFLVDADGRRAPLAPLGWQHGIGP